MDSKYKVLAVAKVVMPTVPKAKHSVGGKLLQDICSVAIVELSGAAGYYLIYLDEHGVELTDTYHESVEAAKEQANFEFGLEHTEWKSAQGM